MMSLTQINRQKSCVNIPRSKKDAHKHKYKCGAVSDICRLQTTADCRLQTTDYRLHTVDLRP